MLKWNQLNQELVTMANRHSLLAAKFEEFAKLVKTQVTSPVFHIKGISVSLNFEQGIFYTIFAGRTLQFAFSSLPSENGSLIGSIKCSLVNEHPKKTLIPVGEFTFTANGKTNLITPEDEPIVIDDDIPSLYVAFHFIHESVTKSTALSTNQNNAICAASPASATG